MSSGSVMVPASIQRMKHRNYRFYIKLPEGVKRRNCYYGKTTLNELRESKEVPFIIKEVLEEIARIRGVENFYLNIGGDIRDRITVKFADDCDEEGLVEVIKEILERPELLA